LRRAPASPVRAGKRSGGVSFEIRHAEPSDAEQLTRLADAV